MFIYEDLVRIGIALEYQFDIYTKNADMAVTDRERAYWVQEADAVDYLRKFVMTKLSVTESHG